MRLLVATGNKGKLREIASILAGSGVEVVGLSQMGIEAKVEEDGETFLANAQKKARTLHALTGLATLADDSGLTVEALGGAPGVKSARYAHENATDEENYQKLLAAMEDVPEDKRSAAFICSLVLIAPDGAETATEGRLDGSIAFAPRGNGGFGYDPVFLLAEGGLTLAEAEEAHKNLISHRADALAKMGGALKALTREA